MKLNFALIIFSCLGSSAFAQVAPSASGGATMASTPRGIQYAFRYSHTASFSHQYQNEQLSMVSGSVRYANRDLEKPFIMDYAGGYNFTLSGPGYSTGQFHHMYLSQGANLRRWHFSVADNVSYLPQSPTTGFSGIPGTGETIGLPNPVSSSTQSILTVSTHVLNNFAAGEMEHVLNYATNVTFGGGSDYLHFPDGNGIDSRSISANANLERRINPRTRLFGRYIYSVYDFAGTGVSMNTQTALVGIRRRVTRNLSADISSGPQRIDSNVTTLIPANLSYAVNASAVYTVRNTTFSGIYVHGTNSGGGYLMGGAVDNGQGDFLRQFGRKFALGISGGYLRTAAFNNNGVTNGAFGGAQGTWWLGRNMIVFANYTGTTQTSTSSLPGNALNQTLHRLSFGFGLSSREQRVRP
jgi:hypothetical protein